jgi:hypothetical protein
VLETATEQDKAIRALAESELADLETQPDDVVEDDPSDSSDEDY